MAQALGLIQELSEVQCIWDNMCVHICSREGGVRYLWDSGRAYRSWTWVLESHRRGKTKSVC